MFAMHNDVKRLIEFSIENNLESAAPCSRCFLPRRFKGYTTSAYRNESNFCTGGASKIRPQPTFCGIFTIRTTRPRRRKSNSRQRIPQTDESTAILNRLESRLSPRRANYRKWFGSRQCETPHTRFGEELYGIAAFIGVIWAVFAVSQFIPRLDSFGVVPRTLHGLIGIPAGAFLHYDLRHILSNTFPLFILLALLAGSRARSWEIVVDIVLLGGSLLWLCGRPATHIGASGLIFGLIAFLILSGLLERRFVPLAIAAIVGFGYGGTLISGVLPRSVPRSPGRGISAASLPVGSWPMR